MRGWSRFYWLAGGSLLAVLLALAGCGRSSLNWGAAEREAWRTQAEAECIKSGAVKPTAAVVRMDPVGDGYCGANYPFKVAALGEGPTALGYAEPPRPPGVIPSGGMPQWPAGDARYAAPPPVARTPNGESLQWTPGPPPARQPSAPLAIAPASGSLDDVAIGRGHGRAAPAYEPRNVAPAYEPRAIMPPAYEPRVSAPPGYEPPQYRQPTYEPPQQTYRAPQAQPLSRPRYEPPRNEAPYQQPRYAPTVPDDDIPDDAVLPNRSGAMPSRDPYRAPPRETYAPPPPQRETYAPAARPLSGPRLGPQRNYTPVKAAVTPPATLACPIVTSLDKWVADGIQPAAMRWFGQPVVEIKQISSYSCRGMVGGSGVSEHAFGNALDVAGFVLADGRKVMVKSGWHGAPEEAGFLHDVHGSACQYFQTVLGPGYNIYHYDHFHVDLKQRSSGNTSCRPNPVSGEVAAARQAQKSKYANRRDPLITGSIGRKSKRSQDYAEDAETAGARGKKIPIAVAGEDGDVEDE
jgi:hypothetical protein